MSLFCPQRLIPRDFTSDAKSTAKSFRSWDTCMDNKACKIIAIVGIVLASIVVIWIVGSLLRCFKEGASGIAEFFCWCCCSNKSKRRDMMPQQHMPANNPPTVIYQPIQQPQTAYYRGTDAYYDERGDSPNRKSDLYEVEQDFDLEEQRRKTARKNAKNDQVPLITDEEDEEHELSTFHPRMATYNPEPTSHGSPYTNYNAQPTTSYNPLAATPYTPQSANPTAPYPRDEEEKPYGYNYRHGGY